MSPNKDIKMTKKKWWRKTCRSMAWCFANVLTSPRNSPKWLMSNHQTSSNLPRNSSKNTFSKFRPPYAWRSKKCKSLTYLPQRSRGEPRYVPHGGRWHWGRGRRPSRRRRTFHRPRRSILMCGRSALRAPFRSGTADSNDWPGESGPSRELTWNGCAKSNHDSGSTKNSCPLARNLPKFMFFLPLHRPFVIKMGWDSFSHETKPRETCITSMSAHFTGRA